VHLPFTLTEFLAVFEAYNRALWPAVILFWIAAFVLSLQLVRGRARSRAISAFVAVHWGWIGIVYHGVFFTQINPAAWGFAALFILEAAAFLWFSVVRNRLTYVWKASFKHALGGAFLAYSLLYPALTLLTGHQLPGGPAFAVPCPAVLLTTGLLLLTAPTAPRWLFVAPIVWSIIGGSAALLFGMTHDLALIAAGAVLAVYAITPEKADGKPAYESTLVVTIRARPEHIWPWLVQMGYQRGGLYSYDWLDRLFGFLDRPSADRVLPEFQSLQVGDVIPIGRGAGFPVAGIDPRRALSLGGTQDNVRWIWDLLLDPVDERRTRLVSRNRGWVPGTVKWTLFLFLLRPAAFIMTRRMLIGLKQRAEALAVDAHTRVVRAA
jgi:hypothetical protein